MPESDYQFCRFRGASVDPQIPLHILILFLSDSVQLLHKSVLHLKRTAASKVITVSPSVSETVARNPVLNYFFCSWHITAAWKRPLKFKHENVNLKHFVWRNLYEPISNTVLICPQISMSLKKFQARQLCLNSLGARAQVPYPRVWELCGPPACNSMEISSFQNQLTTPKQILNGKLPGNSSAASFIFKVIHLKADS